MITAVPVFFDNALTNIFIEIYSLTETEAFGHAGEEKIGESAGEFKL